MARRDDVLGVSGAETVIGAGVVVEGTLDSEGDILIDGSFKGAIEARGDVTLGVNAKVNANVTANNVIVVGSLTGNITAEGEAAIRETGHVKGDITCISLDISSGGVFLGRSKMQTAPILERPTEEEPEKPGEDAHAEDAPE